MPFSLMVEETSTLAALVERNFLPWLYEWHSSDH